MSHKPSAASRTVSLFEGVAPRPSAEAPAREVRSGFAEKAGQPGLFGALQLELGDAARMARDAARKAFQDMPSSPTAKAIAKQQAQLDAARDATAEATRHAAAARDTERRIRELEAEIEARKVDIKSLRASVKTLDKKAAAARAKAAKLAKVRP